MRVITGRARGMTLETPEGLDTRPTIERVKEAIFSSLFTDVLGARVLDLFAGSGQMGIEALSRGAKHAVFVDSFKTAADMIRGNLKKTHLESCASVANTEVKTQLAKEKAKFDLVFMDPPYGKNLVNETMTLLTQKELLTDRAVIVCESDERDEILDRFGGFALARQARYGRVKICYFRKTMREG